MPHRSDFPFGGLNRLFHEPSRLAIISALCSEVNGLTFNQLKQECNLTDGNLSRHLKTLEEAGVIEIQKYFAGTRPQTRVVLTDSGRERFVDYLKALEEVLKTAAEALTSGKKGMPELSWLTAAQALSRG